MSDPNPLEPLIFDLVTVVERLAALHEELALLIQTKLRAMKSNLVQELRETADQEHRLLRDILNQQERRHRIVELAGKKLGMSSHRARTTPLKQWAQYGRDPLNSRVIDAGKRLGKTISFVAQLNRVAGLAAKETIEHLNAALTPAAFDPAGVTYDGGGRWSRAASEPLFSAVY